MSVKDDVYFSFQGEAIRRVLSKLLEKAKAFLNPDYGLKKGTGEQFRKLHGRLFTMAPDFKSTITQMVGI